MSLEKVDMISEHFLLSYKEFLSIHVVSFECSTKYLGYSG